MRHNYTVVLIRKPAFLAELAALEFFFFLKINFTEESPRVLWVVRRSFAFSGDEFETLL